jgi:hypothetical protein
MPIMLRLSMVHLPDHCFELRTGAPRAPRASDHLQTSV